MQGCDVSCGPKEKVVPIVTIEEPVLIDVSRAPSGDPLDLTLLDEMDRAKERRPQIYLTQVIAPIALLTTTSKDLHLKVGALCYDGQRQLVLLFRREFRKTIKTVLFFHFANESRLLCVGVNDAPRDGDPIHFTLGYAN